MFDLNKGIPKGVLMLIQSLLPADYDPQKLAGAIDAVPTAINTVVSSIQQIELRLSRIEAALEPQLTAKQNLDDRQLLQETTPNAG